MTLRNVNEPHPVSWRPWGPWGCPKEEGSLESAAHQTPAAISILPWVSSLPAHPADIRLAVPTSTSANSLQWIQLYIHTYTFYWFRFSAEFWLVPHLRTFSFFELRLTLGNIRQTNCRTFYKMPDQYSTLSRSSKTRHKELEKSETLSQPRGA